MNKYQLIVFTINFVTILGNLITYAVIGRVLVSWFTMGNPYARGRVAKFLYDVTEPIFSIARKIPHRIGMMDLSPIIVLVGIDFLVRFIIMGLNKLL